jgi:hypothetical protein
MHEKTQEELVHGPKYKPSLIANNEKYLPDGGS